MSNTSTAEVTPTTENGPKGTVGTMTILVPVLASTVLTLGVVCGGAAYLIRSGKLAAATGAAAAPVVVVTAPPPSHVLALEPMIVNLSDEGGRSYLRATITLRIKDEAKAESAKEEKKNPKEPDATAVELRDNTLAVLSRQTSESLLSATGREDLKKQLEVEYKQHVPDVSVLDVFFTDFLVQRG